MQQEEGKKINLLLEGDKRDANVELSKIKNSASHNEKIEYFVPEKQEERAIPQKAIEKSEVSAKLPVKNTEKLSTDYTIKKYSFWENFKKGLRELLEGKPKTQKKKNIPQYNLPETIVEQKQKVNRIELDQAANKGIFAEENKTKSALPRFNLSKYRNILENNNLAAQKIAADRAQELQAEKERLEEDAAEDRRLKILEDRLKQLENNQVEEESEQAEKEQLAKLEKERDRKRKELEQLEKTKEEEKRREYVRLVKIEEEKVKREEQEKEAARLKQIEEELAKKEDARLKRIEEEKAKKEKQRKEEKEARLKKIEDELEKKETERSKQIEEEKLRKEKQREEEKEARLKKIEKEKEKEKQKEQEEREEKKKKEKEAKSKKDKKEQIEAEVARLKAIEDDLKKDDKKTHAENDPKIQQMFDDLVNSFDTPAKKKNEKIKETKETKEVKEIKNKINHPSKKENKDKDKEKKKHEKKELDKTVGESDKKEKRDVLMDLVSDSENKKDKKKELKKDKKEVDASKKETGSFLSQNKEDAKTFTLPEESDDDDTYTGSGDIKYSKPKYLNDIDAVEISLVPENERDEKNYFKRNLSYIISWVVVCTLFSAGLYWFSSTKLNDLTIVKNGLENEKVSIQTKLAKMNEMKAKVQVLENKLNESKNLLDNHIYWTNLFVALERHTHSQVSYSGFSGSSGDELVLSASAPNYSIAAKQLLIFQSAKDFVTNVSISGITTDEGTEDRTGGVNFSITLTLNNNVFKYQNNQIE